MLFKNAWNLADYLASSYSVRYQTRWSQCW